MTQERRIPVCETRLILFIFWLFYGLFLVVIFVLEEVIVEIVIEIILEIFQIIRGEETVYAVCDGCNCCYHADDGKDPENTGFLLKL